MKKLLFALAGAASFAALAADPTPGASDISIVGFENYTADRTVIGYGDDGASGNSLWTATGDDASLVKAYGGDNAAAPNIKEPAPFDGAAENTKYLALDTNGSELQRAVGATVAATGTYIDTLVQFTPSESAPTSTDLDGAKLAIWLGVDSENNTTNLMVQACYWDFADAPVGTSQAFALTGKTIEPGTWYRLTVKAIDNIMNVDSGMSIPAFQILVDGTEMTLASGPLSSGFLEILDQSSMYGSADIQAAIAANKLVPSIQAEAGQYGAAVTLTSVGFKGTGALDDFVVTTAVPDFTPAAIDFTLTWPAGLTASYQIGDGAPVSLANETSPFAVPGLAAGDVVKLIVQNADGATKTLTGTAGTDTALDATGTTFGWPEYLGEAVAGAYTIDDFADLDMLRKGVAAGLATVGETFNQTANIDMTSAGAFAGIGAYNANPTLGTPFAGTYDGQGFKIANVTMSARNYGGIFNQVNGGTIQNLTVENISVASGATGEYGYAIVGNAGNGATLQNLVAAGSFLSAATPGTHNMAGIVVRECGGGENGSLIKDCTNNATIYGDYTKLAGICALTQLKVSGGGPAMFDGCVNNGTLISARTSEANSASAITGIAGIVGYTADATVLKDCVNNGTITVALANQKVGELVGSGGVESGSLTDAGGNKADATKKMLHTRSAVTGFLYATVENGVATTVTTLAKDTTYLLEGNVAASETPVFTLAAAGDTIAFDAALGYTFAGTIAGAEGLTVTDATSGTVTTYTAAAAGGADYQVTIGSDDVVITPTAEDLAAVQAAVVAAGGTLDVTDVAAVNAALDTVVTNGVKVWEALFLGLPPTEAGLESFKIDSITVGTDGNVTVALPAGVDPKTGRGVTITLKLMGSDDLSTWTQIETAGGEDNKTFAPVTPGSGETKKFYKVVVDFAGSQN